MADRPFGRDMDAVGPRLLDQLRDLRRARQRQPQIADSSASRRCGTIAASGNSTSTPSPGAPRAIVVSVRTTPLTWGCQASVATRMRIRRPALRAARDRRRRSRGSGPGDDLEPAVVVLDERRAALDPVAAIHVADAVLVADGGVVDVAADHAVGAVPPRLGRPACCSNAPI